MENMFQKNLKKLAEEYSQKYIASKTGFSQSSINNYLTKSSEPSIQFLIALKNAFGISVDDFLFSAYQIEKQASFDKYIGNFIVYYYNNDSYKGEIHSNLKNTLNCGVISVFKPNESSQDVMVYATFMKNRSFATKILKACNSASSAVQIMEIYNTMGSFYQGDISFNDQSIFFELKSIENNDQTYIILNNPPTKSNYIGGVGTVNSIARGREHNPCIQYIIISKRLLDIPDGELYEILNFSDYSVDLEDTIKEIIDLLKRLYVEKNEISLELTDNQKQAIIRNKLEYHFNEILEANAFRFAKITNKEDDDIYRLIKEGIDV